MRNSGMKRVTLEIQYADKRTEMKQLEDGTYIIGRDTGDIVLHSSLVSGRHGELKVSGSRVVYTDQGSTNGTFAMDGSRLSGPLQMTAGTGLRIGECKVILKAIHVLTSKTVMQPAVKPAFSSTKTVLGQPAMIPPPASVPPAQPAQAAPPAQSQSLPRPAQARPSVSPAAAPAPATSVPPAASVPPPAASVPPAASASPASAATEPAPPPYAAEPAANSTGAVEAEPAAAASVGGAVGVASAPVGGSGAAGAESASASGASAPTVNGYAYKMDIGGMINTPMKDKDWIVKSLIIGVMTLIPILGALNMMGWMIAYYNNLRQGVEELPPANLSYWKDGVKVLLAWLPAVGVYVVVAIVMTILTAILPVLGLLGLIIYPVVGFAIFAMTPAVMYLCIVKDVKWASMKIPAIMAFIKANTGAYIQLLIAFVVAGAVGGLLGILTIGFGTAMQSVILAEVEEE